jgi:hypothetical protein
MAKEAWGNGEESPRDYYKYVFEPDTQAFALQVLYLLNRYAETQ